MNTRSGLSHLLGHLLRLPQRLLSRGGGVEVERIRPVELLLATLSCRWESVIEALPEEEIPPPTPLTRLSQGLALPEDALSALLLALSPQVDPLFGQVWGILAGSERPNLNQAIDLLAEGPLQRLKLQAELDPVAPLRRWALVEMDTRGELRPAPRLARFLVGEDDLDPGLIPRVKEVHATPVAHPLEGGLPGQVRDLRLKLVGTPGALVLVKGNAGTGRRDIALDLATLWRGPVLEVDLWGRWNGKAMGGEELPRLLREVALLQPLLILDATGPESELGSIKPVLSDLLHRCQAPVVVISQILKLADLAPSGRHLWLLDVPRPSFAAQQQLWADQLKKQGPVEKGVDLSPILAERFDLTAPQISSAAQVARTLVDSRTPGAPIQFGDLQRGSLELITHSLGDLAWRLPPSQLTWDDLIIPSEARRQLTLMVSYIAHRRTVYDRWGFGRYLSGGRGIKALFYGPPGTGKTMAAGLVARDLGLDVYQVDLSKIVSKWVGETEKNLDRLLTVAQDSHVVLLFDEADALFGERGDVKSATDRYANLEVNFLLQRFDAYDGVVVLTSNLAKSVDKAFSRRLHFLVEFPFPDEPQRLAIWKRLMSGDLPMARSVDVVALSRRFELSGGNIRNAMLTAAFLAAEAGSQIEQVHVLQALLWEMQKMGMVPSRSAFGELWSELV